MTGGTRCLRDGVLGPLLRPRDGPARPRALGMWPGRGRMGRTQSSEGGQAPGRWLVLFLREKGMETETQKNRDSETEGETERDSEQKERRRETQRLRETGAGEDPTHSQGEAGGGGGRQGEPRRRGSVEGARPLLHSDLRLTKTSGQERGLPLAGVPMSPHQVPARGRHPQRGPTEVLGVATRSLSPEGAKHQCPPCPGQAPS